MGGVIKIEILIRLMSITSSTKTIIIWGLGRKRRVVVVTGRHIRSVCRTHFLVWVVRVLMLVLPWA